MLVVVWRDIFVVLLTPVPATPASDLALSGAVVQLMRVLLNDIFAILSLPALACFLAGKESLAGEMRYCAPGVDDKERKEIERR